MHKKDYISKLDRMLEKMRQKSERTPQELAEIHKYNRVNYLRDNPYTETPEDTLI